MENTTNITFKERAFGGYAKEDVHQYLQELNTKMAEKEAMFETQLREKNDEIAAMRAQISSLQDALAEAQEKATEAERLCSESLEEQRNTLSEQLSAAQAEIVTLQQQNTAQEKEKVQLYDKMSNQLGTILIQANEKADAILRAAESDSEALRAATLSESERIKETTRARAVQLFDEATVALKEMSESYLADYRRYVEDSAAKLRATLEQMQQQAIALEEGFSVYCTQTADKMQSEMNSADLQFAEQEDATDAESWL